MSIECDASDCRKSAEFECTCDTKFTSCYGHSKDHSRTCKMPQNFIEELLAQQSTTLIVHIKYCKELKEKILHQCSNLIHMIQKKCDSVIEAIDKLIRILNSIELGRNFDIDKAKNIANIEIVDIDYKPYMELINESFKFQDKNQRVANASTISIVEMPLDEKKTYLENIQIKLPKDIVEIKFTSDGKFVFICNEIFRW